MLSLTWGARLTQRREFQVDEIRCSIKIEDRAEGKPRLIGTLMSYGERARDRAETFLPGSLKWDAGGIILNRQHRRSAPILRFKPIESAGRVLIDVELPATSAGIDALAEVRSGLFGSLSIEFKSIRESFVAGCRQISEAILTGAALCDAGAYSSSVVEAREMAVRRASDRHTREFLL